MSPPSLVSAETDDRDWLRAYATRHNLSHAELSALIGCNVVLISLYLNGIRRGVPIVPWIRRQRLVQEDDTRINP